MSGMAKSKRKRGKKGKASRVRSFKELATEINRHADSLEKTVERFGKGRKTLELVGSDALACVASAVRDLREGAEDAEDEFDPDEDDEYEVEVRLGGNDED